MRKTLLLLGLLPFVALDTRSQVVWPPAVFSPSAPTARDRIRSTFVVPGGCGTTMSTVLAGSVIRTTVLFTGCILGPPPAPIPGAFTDFGPFPANSYTYEIRFLYEDGFTELRSQQPLVIAPDPFAIPSLSWFALVALGLTLAIVAVVTLARVHTP